MYLYDEVFHRNVYLEKDRKKKRKWFIWKIYKMDEWYRF